MTKRDVIATSLPPGTTIAGRYEVVRLLGAGGMGSVYEAIQLAIGRRVALKVLRPDVADDPLVEARFQREARAAASVDHPSVVVVHEFGRGDDGTLFLAMELLHGASLLTRIRELARASAVMAPEEAVAIACEIASALEAAHAAGVVHRDLKPDNVMLLDGGGVKVLDFGIARILEDERASAAGDRAQLTDAQQMLGTPRYMSPEAVARLPVGPSADLYALGAILFEMLTGRPVFLEKEPVLLMGQHLREPPPRLTEARPDAAAPPALEALVDAMLAKAPGQRPESAAEVRRGLLAIDWSAPRPARVAPPGPAVPSGAPAAIAAHAREPERVSGAPETAPTSAARFEPPAPRPGRADRLTREPSSRLAALRGALVVLGVVGVVGALAINRVRLDEERAHPSEPSVDPTPSVPLGPRVEQALITVQTNVADAEVYWDGERMTGTSFAVTVDRRAHRLELRAAGHAPRQAEVFADGPHTISLPFEASRARRR